MTPAFTIDVDPRRDLVRITLSGLFGDRSMVDFLTARKLAFEQLHCGPNAHLSLTDVRSIAIQTQEMVARWGAVLADPAYRSRRLGFIVATTLARSQLQRALGSRDARVFLDPAEAENWVLAAGPARRAA